MPANDVIQNPQVSEGAERSERSQARAANSESLNNVRAEAFGPDARQSSTFDAYKFHGENKADTPSVFQDGKLPELRLVEWDGSSVYRNKDHGNRVESVTFAGGEKSAKISYADDKATVPNRIDISEKGDSGTTTKSFRKQDDGSWHLYVNGQHITQMPGEAKVGKDGSISYASGDGRWQTETRDGKIVQEDPAAGGAKVRLDAEGRVSEVTRGDGSKVEVATADGKQSQIKETSKDGATSTWDRDGDKWTSADKPGEVRQNMRVSENGVTTYETADGKRHHTMGDGTTISEPANTKRFNFDKEGRLTAMTFPGGDSRSVHHRDDTNVIDQLSHRVARTGEVYEYTRIGDQDRWAFRKIDSNGNVRQTGIWNGSIEHRANGSIAVRDGEGNNRRVDGSWQVVRPEGGVTREHIDGRVVQESPRTPQTADSARPLQREAQREAQPYVIEGCSGGRCYINRGFGRPMQQQPYQIESAQPQQYDAQQGAQRQDAQRQESQRQEALRQQEALRLQEAQRQQQRQEQLQQEFRMRQIIDLNQFRYQMPGGSCANGQCGQSRPFGGYFRSR